VEDAERRYLREPADGLTPERIFERRWALTLLEQVLTALETEHRESAKTSLFETLKVYLVADDRAPTYAQAAARLGMSEGAVKVAVFRLRERYRQILRAEVARTLGSIGEVDDEIRSLFGALAP